MPRSRAGRGGGSTLLNGGCRGRDPEVRTESPRSLDSPVKRVIDGLRRLTFVLLYAAIVAVGSERVFWYWASSPIDHGVVTLVDAPAVAAVLRLVDRYRVGEIWGVLLVAPVFGLLVEGVITPVVHTGGPLLGVFRGAWSITLPLPENVGDPEMVADHGGPLHVLGPSEFTLYAVTFSAVLAGARPLLGRGWWMQSFEPTRPVKALRVVVTGGIVIAWTFVIMYGIIALQSFAGAVVFIAPLPPCRPVTGPACTPGVARSPCA